MAGFKHAIAVKARLDEVIEQTPDNEFVFYKGDLNDKAIAKEFDCSEEFVAQIRREFFGKLKRATGNSTRGRVDQLEYQNALLEKKLDDLRSRFNRLIDNLTLNRIVDVKHLKSSQLDLKGDDEDRAKVK